MKIHFYGAASCVTGSCYVIDTEKRKFMIDCGMFQGNKAMKDRNYTEFPFNPAEIDFMILTHAHVDHSGLIPKLVKKGFKGTIFCTTATKDLCTIVLPDSGYIQEMEVERKNRKLSRAGEPLLEPIYTSNDAFDSLNLFHGVPMKDIITIDDEISFKFNEAGHILGSSIIELWVGGEKIVFSGDLGNKNQPIIKDPDYISEADYLVIESTYGDRKHSDQYNKEEKLIEIIKDTFARGGNLIIPAFAVERTQDLLYYLHNIKNSGIFDNLPIYVDSPLAIKATNIFCNRQEYYDAETAELAKFNNECPFIYDDITFTQTAEESKNINTIKTGSIIISASGMAEAGRIKHHLKHNLWRAESTVLFVGYQAIGTLGRRIKDGEKTVRIHGEEVAVNAKILYLDGFSAHADQDGLIDWIDHFETFPHHVFIVHGEEESSGEFARIVKEKYATNVTIPKLEESFELEPTEIKTLNVVSDISSNNITNLFGDIISSLTSKVSKGLERKEYARLLEKLNRLKDNVDKI